MYWGHIGTAVGLGPSHPTQQSRHMTQSEDYVEAQLTVKRSLFEVLLCIFAWEGELFRNQLL